MSMWHNFIRENNIFLEFKFKKKTLTAVIEKNNKFVVTCKYISALLQLEVRIVLSANNYKDADGNKKMKHFCIYIYLAFN